MQKHMYGQFISFCNTLKLGDCGTWKTLNLHHWHGSFIADPPGGLSTTLRPGYLFFIFCLLLEVTLKRVNYSFICRAKEKLTLRKRQFKNSECQIDVSMLFFSQRPRWFVKANGTQGTVWRQNICRTVSYPRIVWRNPKSSGDN